MREVLTAPKLTKMCRTLRLRGSTPGSKIMRKSEANGGLKVLAISGTYVVLLGLHLDKTTCHGLLGFSIHRVDHTENEAYYLEGMKCFKATDPQLAAGSLYSTRDHPIQSFQWADYTAKPGHDYTYTVTALAGSPEHLRQIATTAVRLQSESPVGGEHDIYFNRGVAGSQAYVRRFGNRAPDKVPNRQAFVWLSRGLNEALEEFVTSCDPAKHALRIAAYEFNYVPFLQVLKDAIDGGRDIKIIYDARGEKPGRANTVAVEAMGLDSVSTRRTVGASYISHNKFIVKLEDGEPMEVWTGGTNFSENGIYGHSNVAHVVQDGTIAGAYLDYWQQLAKDPSMAAIKEQTEIISKTLGHPPPVGTSVCFSPRANLDMLDWYGKLATDAGEGLFMTFAFGMNDRFKSAYKHGKARFRLALFESLIRPMKDGPAKQAELAHMQELRNLPENTFAVGEFIRTNMLDGWVKERLTGLSVNVRYIHNKFMLVDPLSDDPIVVAGSANFSVSSTNENDENMLVVRGNTRVADIYLGEFMRLYTHHAFRESLKWRKQDEPVKHLTTDDWWSDYFGGTSRSIRRQFFARVKH
jgi:phosphatidylserine/phosphatidylglycerophosphate/cardiolipin synthase-like enzyme